MGLPGTESANSHIIWLVSISCVLLILYIFYPAIVAAAAPVLRSDEIPMSSSVPLNGKEESSILLSLVIPAYNEELRLEIMLQEAFDYLIQKDCPALSSLLKASPGRQNLVEFILVDDGSKDQTERVYQNFAKKAQCGDENNRNWSSVTTKTIFRLLRLRRNAGKGAAVQTGMLAARGAFGLMVDADGATAFGPGLEAVSAHAASHDFILGSRADLDHNGTAKVDRSPLRRILQSGFHWLVVLLVGTKEIQDTQCGFKLFRGSIIPMLFGRLHLRRWAFDTELLYRAAGVQLRLKEVSVPWHEVEGSHLHTGPLSLARVASGMLRDMLCVRLCYSLRIWKVPRRPPGETNKDR